LGTRISISKPNILDAPKWHFAVYCERYTPRQPMGSGQVVETDHLYYNESLEANLKAMGKRQSHLLVEIWL
jgi:hypothetical protein